jgi:IS30 family transposase
LYYIARDLRTSKLVIGRELRNDKKDHEIIERYPNYKTAEAKLKSIGKPKTAKQKKQAQIDNLLNVYQFLGSSKER